MTTEEAVRKVRRRLESTQSIHDAAAREMDVLGILLDALQVGFLCEENLPIIMDVLREDEL